VSILASSHAAWPQGKQPSPEVTKPELWFGVGSLQELNSIALAPDGKTLVVCGSAKQPISIADVTDPKNQKLLPIEKKYVGRAVFAPDGKTMVSTTLGGPNRIWEVGSWKLVRELKSYGKGSVHLAYSFDGKQLATVEEDCKVLLWDLEGGKEPVIFPPLNSPPKNIDRPLRIAFSPDGKTLAIGHWGGHVELRDLAAPVPFKDLGTQKPRLTIESGGMRLCFVGFAENGRLLVTGSEFDQVQVWDAQTGKRSYALNLKNKIAYIQALAISPDGKTLAIAGSGEYVRFFDVNTGEPSALLGPHKSSASGLAFSKDGATLVSEAKGYIYVFNLTKKK
jgi:WD40 repeat protein